MKRPITKFSLATFIFLFCTALKAQNPIGIPQINTYNSLDYKGGSQNWDIDQDKNGLIYFANNEGLLVFDGRNWKLYALPHKTIVRSIAIAGDGKIYVGAQDELGYFFPNKNGELIYHSIRHLLPKKERNFSDIWDICEVGDGIFFRSTNRILHWKNGNIKSYKPARLWEFMSDCDGKLYAQDIERGLMRFEHGEWKLLVDRKELQNDFVTSVIKYAEKTLLITTLKSGAFLLNNGIISKMNLDNEQQLRQSKIYKAIPINNNWIAIATSATGCYILDKGGHVVQQFSSAEGLYKNNIRSIFMDRNGNFWLGLDDGINFIAFNNAIKYIYPDKDKQTSGYVSLINKNKLYIGSSNGVYATPITPNVPDLSYSKNYFREIENTSGQVWDVSFQNDKVLVGHEDGAKVIENDKAQKLYAVPGTWLFTKPLASSTTLIAGTYLGLQRIAYKNGTFSNKGYISGLSESLRFLVPYKNAIWASHPYRGIFRLKLSVDDGNIQETKFYAEKSGLPSAWGNVVAKIRGKVVVATKIGIFEYDDKNDKFIPSPFLTPILKQGVYHYLKEDEKGNIWFISHKKVGVVDFHGKPAGNKYTIVHFPELNSLVLAGFEHINPFNDENIFIGAKKGLIHLNYKAYSKNIRPVNVRLSSIKTIGEKSKVIFGGYFLTDGKISAGQNTKDKINLDKKDNSLHFEFSSTLYEQQNNIEFSYQLEGAETDWSPWTGKNEKDYTNLPYGRYLFKVKARNNLGNESEVATYAFYIKPAWHETIWIYAFYVVALIAILFALIARQKKIHKKEQDHLKHLHQLEIDSNEKQIVQLQNDKLETEVNYKNKELATMGMNLLQKNKLISKIKEEIVNIAKSSPADDNYDTYIRKVNRLLNEAENGNADWEQFAVHFDHVHSNFLAKLKQKFPNLGANDLKLCAYLKLNLSSKEIAQLMGITPRAIEVSRYRLRKKINVPVDQALFDYLIQATS